MNTNLSVQELISSTVDVRQQGLIQELLGERSVLDTMQKVLQDPQIVPLSWMTLDILVQLLVLMLRASLKDASLKDACSDASLF
jgi:hypothetical protein